MFPYTSPFSEELRTTPCRYIDVKSASLQCLGLKRVYQLLLLWLKYQSSWDPPCLFSVHSLTTKYAGLIKEDPLVDAFCLMIGSVFPRDNCTGGIRTSKSVLIYKVRTVTWRALMRVKIFLKDNMYNILKGMSLATLWETALLKTMWSSSTSPKAGLMPWTSVRNVTPPLVTSPARPSRIMWPSSWPMRNCRSVCGSGWSGTCSIRGLPWCGRGVRRWSMTSGMAVSPATPP